MAISIRARIVKSILKRLPRKSSRVRPTQTDLDGLRQAYAKMMRRYLRPLPNTKIRVGQIAGVGVEWLRVPESASTTIIYLHGGGFVFGSSAGTEQLMARMAKACRAKVIGIDYALAPEHPYPEALVEIQRVWEHLLAEGLNPANVVFIGESAGGNLAIASALRFREAGIPQPACIVLLSSGLDATFSGTSYSEAEDPLFTQDRIDFFADSYVGTNAKNNPFISPVFANLHDLPPMLVHVGEDELLRSDSERLAQNAKRDGAELALYVAPGMWHNWHLYAGYVPEAQRDIQSVGEFVRSKISEL